ncbi:BCCT family transporter [Spongorhabdus nitratireducens]
MPSDGERGRFVFLTGLTLILGIVLAGMIFPEQLGAAGNKTMGFLTRSFGWLYNGAAFTFVIFCLGLGLSRYGDIRLGDEPPEYSSVTWFAMLFSAGMGIGLVFWGAAEPLHHWLNPIEPLAGGSPEAAAFAMRKSFLHWGLQPWAIYAVLGLPLAYLMYCRRQNGLISNLLLPFIPAASSRSNLGRLINVVALFATAGGIATSLGLGVQQINSGMSFVFGMPDTPLVKILMVAVITLLVVICTVTGMQRGIKYLCSLNLIIAVAILIISFVVGPSVEILNTFTSTLGNYIQHWFADSLAISGNPWYVHWTVFYMAWWMAWAPFCAPFIARVSRGRTVREFVFGALMAPSLGSFLWFAVFGTMGISAGPETAGEAISSLPTALFVVLDGYPLGSFISGLVIVVLFTFFITSANGATYVLGVLSSNGQPRPSITMKIVWSVLPAALALVLMLESENGLCLLQTMAIIAAFPFMLVLILGMFCLMRLLHEDYPVSGRPRAKSHHPSQGDHHCSKIGR